MYVRTYVQRTPYKPSGVNCVHIGGMHAFEHGFGLNVNLVLYLKLVVNHT